MNHIPLKQNEQKQLERLAAQRELYSSAKKYHGFQIVLTVLIPVLLALISLALPETIDTKVATYAAAIGLIITMLDLFILDPAIKSKRERAAKIQELFDCDVLSLPGSPLKTADGVAVEEVLVQYDAHRKIPTNIEKIRDWYPVAVREFPLSIARIVCQRSNCWWDARLRDRYASIIRTVSVVVVLAIFFFGLVSNVQFLDIVLLGSAIMPFIQFCSKQYFDHKDAAKRLDELANYASNLWKVALEGQKTDKELAEYSRRLQDEIFDHRSKSPLILDMFYNRLRNKDEEIMNRSAQTLLDEAQTKLNF